MLIKNFFGLVEMTFGLVKLNFFAPCLSNQPFLEQQFSVTCTFFFCFRGSINTLSHCHIQSPREHHLWPTIGNKISWDTLTVCHLKKEKIKFSIPNPSMKCCAAVWAACRKQQHPNFWMVGREEGCVLFCFPKLPLLRTICLHNFAADWRWSKIKW